MLRVEPGHHFVVVKKRCCRVLVCGLQMGFQCFLGMWNQKDEDRQWKSCIFLGIGVGELHGDLLQYYLPAGFSSGGSRIKAKPSLLGKILLVFCPFRAIARASLP